MSVAKLQCGSCGRFIDVRGAGPFETADVIGATCSTCAGRQIVDEGGSSLFLRQELDGARFRLGNVVITAGAIAALAESGQHAVAFLARHVRGDWGKVGQCDEIELTDKERRLGWQATDDGAKINKSNLLNCRDGIMSEYVTARGTRIWIVSCLDGSHGTTVMLPQEY
jgi:hypothetical protein